ncbi:AI-2E family transporter [Solimonas sp. SE-A11]|uniref:AI-2E family transporter n=1 Tax=Solimonas sp. SE-A11 TaxID=3054954 RepID=UPI00259C888A|nr:AI-2E family transporter [Solimonas sp. SE-A11]MDM4771199.1 AI-2E family transporter [Solimonas sp. SE-A11]
MSTGPAAETAEGYVRFQLREHWPWLLVGAGLLLLLVMLSPILMPFVVGAGLAYIGDPIVDRLQRLRLSRTAAVCVVFTVLTLIGLLALLLLAPMIYHQFLALLRNIPDWLVWLQNQALPRLGVALPAGVQLDAEGLKAIITEHWTEAGGFAQAAWERVSQSGKLLVITVANLLLIPVVSFYLLRDWDDLIAWIRSVIPPRYLPRLGQMAGEADDVLGAFIRGQLSVMAAQAVFYAVALWLAGLELALVVGIIIGLISFIPYLGSIVGLLIAVIAMLVQTQDPSSLIWVVVIFGVGQFLEGNVLTPWLVGDRIGLHPVTVIFAVMAGGQLFGFVGVLLALPVAAVLAVMMRHTKQQWLTSPLYRAGASQPTLILTDLPPASDEPTSPLP